MRVVGLAGMALVVFGLTTVLLWVGSLFLAAVLLGGSCGDGCYHDVYLGPSVLVAIVVVAAVITSAVVRRVAGKSRPR